MIVYLFLYLCVWLAGWLVDLTRTGIPRMLCVNRSDPLLRPSGPYSFEEVRTQCLPEATSGLVVVVVIGVGFLPYEAFQLVLWISLRFGGGGGVC